MTEPIATVDAKARAELLDLRQLLGTFIVGIFTAMLGYVAGIFVWSPRPMAAVGFAIPPVVFVLGSALNSFTTSYELHEDRAAGSGVFAGWEVPYEEVAFAVRTGTGGDSLSGTADIRLVREDEVDQELKNVEDPDRVQSILDDHLPDPDEWLAGRDDRDTALRAIVARRQEWAEDGEDSPVIDADRFEETTGVDPGEAPLGELAEIDGVETVEDLEPSDFSHESGRARESATGPAEI